MSIWASRGPLPATGSLGNSKGQGALLLGQRGGGFCSGITPALRRVTSSLRTLGAPEAPATHPVVPGGLGPGWAMSPSLCSLSLDLLGVQGLGQQQAWRPTLAV